MKTFRRNSGFTLIEVLVVVSIIVFLMAFLSVLFISYGKSARVKGTKELIRKIALALQSYYGECGRVYPPDSGYGLDVNGPFSGVTYDAGSLWRYLANPVVYRVDATDPGTPRGPYIKFSERELVPYTDPVLGPSCYVVDAWRRPLGYIGDPRRVIHNRGEFDLFSAGPDGKTGCDRKTKPNLAYNNADDDGDGTVDNATELGDAQFNGTLASTAKCLAGEATDDINNWDPAN